MAPSRWARRRGSAHRVRWAAALARSDLRTRSTSSVSVEWCRGYGIGVHNAGIAPAPLSPETTFCLAPTACRPRRSLMLRAGRVHGARVDIPVDSRRRRFPAIVAFLAAASASRPRRTIRTEDHRPHAQTGTRGTSAPRGHARVGQGRVRGQHAGLLGGGAPRGERLITRPTLEIECNACAGGWAVCPWAATRPLLYILFRNSAIAVAIAGAELLAGVHLKGLYSTDSGLKLLET